VRKVEEITKFVNFVPDAGLELNGSRSGSDRFTLLLAYYGKQIPYTNS
jgi:hypothetical protein